VVISVEALLLHARELNADEQHDAQLNRRLVKEREQWGDAAAAALRLAQTAVLRSDAAADAAAAAVKAARDARDDAAAAAAADGAGGGGADGNGGPSDAAVLEAATTMRVQVEWYFGTENWARDEYLRGQAAADPRGDECVSLALILGFKKTKKMLEGLGFKVPSPEVTAAAAATLRLATSLVVVPRPPAADNAAEGGEGGGAPSSLDVDPITGATVEWWMRRARPTGAPQGGDPPPAEVRTDSVPHKDLVVS
jgi:hypothetical protein